MLHILVDCENVQRAWSELLVPAKFRYSMYLFAPQDMGMRTPLDKLHLINNPCKLQWIPTRHGVKDALDIQLSSVLGAIICKNPYDSFIIVSNDKIFRTLCQFWIDFNETHISVITVPQIPFLAEKLRSSNYNNLDYKLMGDFI